jgi:hypothetical protein
MYLNETCYLLNVHILLHNVYNNNNKEETIFRVNKLHLLILFILQYHK